MLAQLLQLGDLTSRDGFTVRGESLRSFSGVSVSAAGDINGDGIEDFIVGAPGSRTNGIDSGGAFVVFGRAGVTRTTLQLSALSPTDGFAIGGHTGDYVGFDISAAGDVNGDGIDDLMVSANTLDASLRTVQAAFVIYGKIGATRTSIDIDAFSTTDGFIVTGDRPDYRQGFNLSSAGDVNGDGIDDLILGSPSLDGGFTKDTAYVIYGKAGETRANLSLSELIRSDGFSITGFRRGISVAGGGDVNGDGIDDIVVGSPVDADSGRACVIYGKAGSARKAINVATIAPTDGFLIFGDAITDQAGFSLSILADVNGDGLADIAVSALTGDNGGRDAGEVYIIYGKAGFGRTPMDLTSFAMSDGFIIQGSRSYGQTGISVSGAGDVNNDGIADIIVGSPTADRNTDHNNASGQAHIIFGRASATRANIDLGSLMLSDGIVINGASMWDRAGISVSSIGDVNDDGIDDILVGANNGNGASNEYGNETGEAYVLYGSSGFGTGISGSLDDDIVNGSPGADYIMALAGNDLIYGDSGSDQLFGGYGNDVLFAGQGHDQLWGDEGNDKLVGDDGDDEINGGQGNDSLRGGDGNDRLSGDDGDDILTGGAGTDTLTGGQGADQFRFRGGDSSRFLNLVDNIADFNRTQGDIIDLAAIDAVDGGTDNAFSFIGTGYFTGVAGQLRVQQAGADCYIIADINGDGEADFTIRVVGLSSLISSDFIL